MAKPLKKILSKANEKKIIQEATALLENPGVYIHNPAVLKMLKNAGVDVNETEFIAKIPEKTVRSSLNTCPSAFSIYNLEGKPTLDFGSGNSAFAPGSSALTILDHHSGKIRPGNTLDLIQHCKIVEVLDQYEAQSTAIVSSDVPEEISDLYRLFLVLSHSSKPIITGAFFSETLSIMVEMLTLVSGGKEELRTRPRGIFDVCPTSPLSWSAAASQNLIDCAQLGIPVQIVPMPLAGATSPVTLAGSVVQHTAECLSGLVIAQTANNGAPTVWGGAPAIFDMRSGSSALGSGASWLLGLAYAQIGQALKIPTQSFLGISDAKTLDAQAGFESASIILGVDSGIDLITGGGMLAQINCQSLEKLIFDADCITLAKYLSQGIKIQEDTIAINLIQDIAHQGNFLTHDHTHNWFKEELYFSSPIIDRRAPTDWIESGSLSAKQRSKGQIDMLLNNYIDPPLDRAVQNELKNIVLSAASPLGMDVLPPLPGR